VTEIEAWLKELLLSLHERNQFAKYLGMEIIRVHKGDSVVSMLVTHRHTNIRKVVHGGAMVSLVDMAMMLSCASLGRRVLTLDLNISFFRRVKEGDWVTAFSRVIHSGNKTVVVEGSIKDKEDKLLSRARGTFFAVGQYQPGDQ